MIFVTFHVSHTLFYDYSSAYCLKISRGDVQTRIQGRSQIATGDFTTISNRRPNYGTMYLHNSL